MSVFAIDRRNLASLSQHSGQNGRIFALYGSTLGVCELALLVKLRTGVHKATTAEDDTSLCCTILVVFLGFLGLPG